MKILHCCLSCFYIDNYNYQENVLPYINKTDGNEVKIIASTEIYIKNSQIGYTNPSRYFNEYGIEVERIAYKKYLPRFIMKKVRHYKNLYELIEEFSPNVILFHGIAAYDLLVVAKYKKYHPEVKFYVDSHEDALNSGTNWLSKNILHKIFYKKIINRACKFIDKIFYITYESKMFLQEFYDIKEEKMEYYPLGGFVFSKEKRANYRKKIREQLFLKDNDFLLMHSGKMSKIKRPQELLEAFLNTTKDNLKLVIIGKIPDDSKDTIEKLIEKDKRIMFLGWKNSNELLKYLCACDLYVQPGGQSVTMQNALCCGSAVALYPYKSHTYLLGEAAFYIKSVDDMTNLFNELENNRDVLESKRRLSYKIACEKLDYEKLAKRLYR